jgi:hypothetical protein
MSSDRQIAANRLNSQKGSGPKTPEGKARVGSNALKHGLTGKRVVLPDENPEEFDEFRLDLISSLDPQGTLEEFFAEKIVTDAWRLRRIPELEAALHARVHRRELIAEANAKVARYEITEQQRICLISDKIEVVPQDREAHDAAKRKRDELMALPESVVARAAYVLEKHANAFANLERYETALFRSLLRALHELERLQARRAGVNVPAPAAIDVDISK